MLGAVAIIPWNPKRRKNRSCLPPTWTKEELGKRSSIERFFGRVFLFFHLQRPPLFGWSTMARQVALTYTATIIVALAAQQAGRPALLPPFPTNRRSRLLLRACSSFFSSVKHGCCSQAAVLIDDDAVFFAGHQGSLSYPVWTSFRP